MVKLKCKREVECKKMLTYVINKLMLELSKQKPKIKNFDSNNFHFMIYKITQKNEKLKNLIPFGWFIHGPYCYLIDDILVETFGMEQKYHQLEGLEPYNREWCKTIFEKKN